MKATTLFLTTLLLALVILTLVPALQQYATFLIGGAAAVAVLLLIVGLRGGGESTGHAAPPDSSEAAKPAPTPPAPRAEAEIVSLLTALQEKGRFIDFLMDDITSYDDNQVGAAARVVHQGCRAVLDEHFDVHPVSTATEGSPVSVPEKHAVDEYRLTGNLGGEPPFTGVLAHKGWKTLAVKLPRLIDTPAGEDRLPAIAPAEVEIK